MQILDTYIVPLIHDIKLYSKILIKKIKFLLNQ